MINTAAKLMFGVAAVSLALAVAYGSAESGDPGGFVLLIGLCLIASLTGLALALSGIKDQAPRYGDAPPIETVAVDQFPDARASMLPLLAAVAGGCFAIGLATGRVVVTAGAVLSMLVAGLWLAQDWREDPHWTPRLRSRISNRLIDPLGLPVVALVLIGVIVISVSRILLAVSKHASVVLAMVFAVSLLVVFFLIASRPRLGRSAIAGLSSLALVALISAGSVGAAHGERRFEEHVTPPPTLSVVAENVKFSVTQLTAPANQQVVVHFANKDSKSTYHNIAVYTLEKQPVVAGEPIHGGKKITYQFQFPPGDYTFRCDFHATMTGTLTVQG